MVFISPLRDFQILQTGLGADRFLLRSFTSSIALRLTVRHLRSNWGLSESAELAKLFKYGLASYWRALEK